MIPLRPAGRTTVVALLGLILLLGACSDGATGATSPTTTTEAATTPAPTAPSDSSESPSPTDDTEELVSTLHLTVGDRVIAVELNDSPTARDLAARVPLTLTFADFNSVEKIAELPAPLTTDGVPAGDDPEPNDLGYYAPSQDLVLYYGDVGYWPGIVRLGHLDEADMAFLQDQPDGFEVSITSP